MKFGFYTIPGLQLLNQKGVVAHLLGSKRLRGHFMLTLNLTFLGSLNHDMLRIVKKCWITSDVFCFNGGKK